MAAGVFSLQFYYLSIV